MSEVQFPSLDGLVIARSVRELAHRAHLALVHHADEAEARELFGAIERLERQIEPEKAGDLGRWLASLRRRVENGLPTEV
jgi:hypothetical protein